MSAEIAPEVTPQATPLDVMLGSDRAVRTPQFVRNTLKRFFRKATPFSEVALCRDAAFGNYAREVFATLYGAAGELAPEDVTAPPWASQELALLRECPEVLRMNEVGYFDPTIVAEAAREVLLARREILEQEETEPKPDEEEPKEKGPGFWNSVLKAVGLGSDPEPEDEAEPVPPPPPALPAAVVAALAAAADKAEEAAGTRSSWGLGTVEMEEATRAIPRFSLDSLRIIAELAGRATHSAYGARAKLNSPGSPVDLERGRAVERYTATELALFADPLTRDIGTERWLQRSALQFQQVADERAGRGPVVIAIDLSASMREKVGDHPRELWARAVALAFVSIALSQGRAVRLIGYDERILYDETPLDEKGAREVLSRQVGYSGTTLGIVYEQLLSEPPEKWEKADLVIVSDGEDNSWQERSRRLRVTRGMRSHAIAIGTSWNQHSIDALSTYVAASGDSVDLTTLYQAI